MTVTNLLTGARQSWGPPRKTTLVVRLPLPSLSMIGLLPTFLKEDALLETDKPPRTAPSAARLPSCVGALNCFTCVCAHACVKSLVCA